MILFLYATTAASAQVRMAVHLCDPTNEPPSPYVGTFACECIRRGETFWYDGVWITAASSTYVINETCFEVTEATNEAVADPTLTAHKVLMDGLVAKAHEYAERRIHKFVHDVLDDPPDMLMSGEMGTEEQWGADLFPYPGGFEVRWPGTNQTAAWLQVGGAPVVEAFPVASPSAPHEDLLVVLATGEVWIAPGPLLGGTYLTPEP